MQVTGVPCPSVPCFSAVFRAFFRLPCSGGRYCLACHVMFIDLDCSADYCALHWNRKRVTDIIVTVTDGARPVRDLQLAAQMFVPGSVIWSRAFEPRPSPAPKVSN